MNNIQPLESRVLFATGAKDLLDGGAGTDILDRDAIDVVLAD